MELLHSRIEGEGKPLLILHGFFGMSDNWKTYGGWYAAEGFQSHMLDLRNHGKSFHSESFTYADMVADVLAYADAKGLDSFYLMGHSMGGKIAMLLATQHPQRVIKLIVADIAPRYYPQHHQDILEGLNSVDFSKKPSRADVEAQLKLHIDEIGTVQFLAKSLYWESPGQLAFRFNLPVLTRDVENVGEALPESEVFDKPALFLRGGNSGYIKERDVEDIRKQFPKSVLVTIKDTGHWLHAEKPQEFFDTTKMFLTQ